jgi:hypothetical protein
VGKKGEEIQSDDLVANILANYINVLSSLRLCTYPSRSAKPFDNLISEKWQW